MGRGPGGSVGGAGWPKLELALRLPRGGVGPLRAHQGCLVALWSWLVRQCTDFTMWLFRATCAMCSSRRKGEGTVFLSSVKDNQSVDEKSLGFEHRVALVVLIYHANCRCLFRYNAVHLSHRDSEEEDCFEFENNRWLVFEYSFTPAVGSPRRPVKKSLTYSHPL